MSLIYFDAERIKYKNVGLFHFCKNLGNSLIKESLQDLSINFTLYVPVDGRIFDNNPSYAFVKGYHKFFHLFRKKPKVWHATQQLTQYMPSAKGIKKILTVHDLNFLREKSELKQEKYLRRLSANVEKSDVVVCISEFVKKELASYCNLDGKEVQVIYNGNTVSDTIKPEKIEISNFDDKKRLIYTVGAILPKKNFHSLLYLLVNNDANLVISGEIFDKSYHAEIIALAKKLNVEHRVFFTGPVSEAQKYYFLQTCNLFCFPSLTEGFGLPVVEAMHFGANILLSPYTSLPEIGGDVVRYFDSFDTEYLIQLGAESSLFEIDDKQREQVQFRSKKFSWDKAAQSYWAIYKKLV
ncbi:glycosyltransferase family 4 protein [Sphingobacterium sp. LRF_L2]|uniref:glycosyltransferase family 4 protein n=1 Tax=Sphingobacterium sp. LRF_L2 TaxID=3369421 RepID=UPI003F6383CA